MTNKLLASEIKKESQENKDCFKYTARVVNNSE